MYWQPRNYQVSVISVFPAAPVRNWHLRSSQSIVTYVSPCPHGVIKAAQRVKVDFGNVGAAITTSEEGGRRLR